MRYMDLAARLALNLKTRRKGLSQEVFARKLGVSRATLTRLENCGQNITLNTLEQLTNAMSCDICDLFKKDDVNR